MAGVRVTMRHVRAAQLAGVGVLCASGVRAWFDAHGMDYRQFVRRGAPVERIESTGDAFALRAAAIAREEAARG